MSYQLPTFEELLKRVRDRHRAELPGTDAFLWPNTEHVFTKVLGGAVHELYQYLGWIKRQRFASEADGDQLDEHGKQWGITRKPAAPAHGDALVTVSADLTLLAGTVFARSDGARFRVKASQNIIANDPPAMVALEALTAGFAGNTEPGTQLEPEVSTPTITNIVVASDGIAGGDEVEGDESYRARILWRQRNPPRGGAAHDYVAWALAINGVTRVWVDPLAYGPGTVGVWFMADGQGNGIPAQSLVGDVAAYTAVVAPTTARVLIHAPIPATIDITISHLGVVIPTVQAAIEAEIRDLFRRQVHVSMPNKRFTFATNLIWQAVARATGSSQHKVKLPADDITFLPGYIPVLGTICYAP